MTDNDSIEDTRIAFDAVIKLQDQITELQIEIVKLKKTIEAMREVVDMAYRGPNWGIGDTLGDWRERIFKKADKVLTSGID